MLMLDARNLFRAALVTGALGFTFISPSQAQDRRDVAIGPNGEEEVIVPAPREWVHRGADGDIALSRDVSYGDLDLSTRDGVRELRARIRDAARDVCEELNDHVRNPGSIIPPDVRGCAREAYRGAMMQVREAVRDDDGYRDARYGGDEY
jgi:UrcA family protein